jgi:hypothetical protein
MQTIEDDDVLTFNDEFESKFKRIRVPLISLKELAGGAGGVAGASGNTDDDYTGGGPGSGAGAVPAAVEEDRRYGISSILFCIGIRRCDGGNFFADTWRKRLSCAF